MIVLLNYRYLMQLLLDQGLPRSAAALLTQAGIDTVHVGEIGYGTAKDFEILQFGQSTGRVVVTVDADFHTLLAHSGAVAPSVIRVRVEGLKAEAFSRLLETVVKQCEEDLVAGAAVTVQTGRVRIHHLPLLPK